MDFRHKKIVITAGGTREPIDPVRFITNKSSGKMGFALAEAAFQRQADVTLISTIQPPENICQHLHLVETVEQMRAKVLEQCKNTDILIMAAAISDFRAESVSNQKIKKSEKTFNLRLIKNEDFLLELPDHFIKIGFAAETENLIDNAQKKLIHKRLHFICANDVSSPDSGFGTDTNRVSIIHKNGLNEQLPLMQKRELADKILDRAHQLLS